MTQPSHYGQASTFSLVVFALPHLKENNIRMIKRSINTSTNTNWLVSELVCSLQGGADSGGKVAHMTERILLQPRGFVCVALFSLHVRET